MKKVLNLKLTKEEILGTESYYNKLENFINENGVNFTIYTKEMENIIFKHIMINQDGKHLDKRSKAYKETFNQLKNTYKTVNHYSLKGFKAIEVIEYK